MGLIFVGGPTGILAESGSERARGAFALQGLAVLHVVTQGLRLRNNLLFVVYLIVVPLLPWSLAPFTLLGLSGSRLFLCATAKKRPSISPQ